MSNVTLNPNLTNDQNHPDYVEIIAPGTALKISGTLKANVLKVANAQETHEYSIEIADGTSLKLSPEKAVEDNALFLRKMMTLGNLGKGLLLVGGIAGAAAAYVYRQSVLSCMKKACEFCIHKPFVALSNIWPTAATWANVAYILTPIIIIGGIYFLVKKACDNNESNPNLTKSINPDFHKKLVQANSSGQALNHPAVRERRASCIPTHSDLSAFHTPKHSIDRKTLHKNEDEVQIRHIDNKLKENDKTTSNTLATKPEKSNDAEDSIAARVKKFHEEKENKKQSSGEDLGSKKEDLSPKTMTKNQAVRNEFGEDLQTFPKATNFRSASAEALVPFSFSPTLPSNETSDVEDNDSETSSDVTNNSILEGVSSDKNMQVVTIIGTDEIVSKAKALTEKSDTPWKQSEVKVMVLSPDRDHTAQSNESAGTPKRSPKHKLD